MTRSFYKRNHTRVLHIPAEMLANGMDVEKVTIEAVPGGIMVRPAKGGVIATVAGIDCFTWEDVEYVGRMMREKGYVPGVNGPKAGSPQDDEDEESRHEP